MTLSFNLLKVIKVVINYFKYSLDTLFMSNTFILVIFIKNKIFTELIYWVISQMNE